MASWAASANGVKQGTDGLEGEVVDEVDNTVSTRTVDRERGSRRTPNSRLVRVAVAILVERLRAPIGRK
ncbi:hypothetical protein CYV19_14405 [Natronobacterium gregoryi SP2]|uniref:Uncharacterized protein n=1 Tax=Natronobacterium gregoryi (strain ATCC 43098 / DSM 3393 / CCM 3738 / CIP 104747 / IAM 13177 / JCM 8860 / NBRC 102187 / NCIMB 2189 / SP2) TaxID=797304 RepID=L9YCC4_NATGS|nr:hypothetical protein C490_04717 [Natronobacterium gregoryi SP2]PLK19534.1 hypothetical protein CYV19_14405 [Natronobacterium gregoryi SP2]